MVFAFWGAGAGSSILSIVNSQPLADGWDEMKKLPADVSEFHARSSAAPDARVKLLLGVPRGKASLASLGTAHRLLYA